MTDWQKNGYWCYSVPPNCLVVSTKKIVKTKLLCTDPESLNRYFCTNRHWTKIQDHFRN